jgi:S-DNA-T family DNA segregation ATPase FtsK/SpoIIIE
VTITVSTAKLIDTLTDALQTADNAVGGVHLATHRAPWRDEPGNVDLLAFTSTDRYTVGHTWIPVDGQLVASVWPVENAATVLTICKSLLSRRGKEHTVDIDLTHAEPLPDAEDDENPGWVVTLSETPALFASDTEFQFHAHPEDKFPIRSMRRVLRFAEYPFSEDEEPLEETALTLWSPGILAPLVAVAKRRKMSMQFFRSSFRRLQVVQIGDTWLGAAIPGTPLPGEHGEQPSIEPIFAEFDLVGAE